MTFMPYRRQFALVERREKNYNFLLRFSNEFQLRCEKTITTPHPLHPFHCLFYSTANKTVLQYQKTREKRKKNIYHRKKIIFAKIIFRAQKTYERVKGLKRKKKCATLLRDNEWEYTHTHSFTH